MKSLTTERQPAATEPLSKAAYGKLNRQTAGHKRTRTRAQTRHRPGNGQRQRETGREGGDEGGSRERALLGVLFFPSGKEWRDEGGMR